MLPAVRSRAVWQLSRGAQVAARRSYAFTANDKEVVNDSQPSKQVPNVSKTNEVPSKSPQASSALQENVEDAENLRTSQAPNRLATWSKSQNPRAKAMSGPRFEQTIMSTQPMAQAAIGLIHQQPVHWTHDRIVSCNGGGGALGHPRVFINLDKPQICMCEYCGNPFANEHHREHLESLSETTYPLHAKGAEAEVAEPQRVTDEVLAQR